MIALSCKKKALSASEQGKKFESLKGKVSRAKKSLKQLGAMDAATATVATNKKGSSPFLSILEGIVDLLIMKNTLHERWAS